MMTRESYILIRTAMEITSIPIRTFTNLRPTPPPPDQTPLAWMDRVFGKVGVYQYLRPFIVGVVHGLAGSAAVALLVLTTVRNVQWAIAYLLVFGVGTIAGMMLITMSIASAFTIVGTGRKKFFHRLALASGLLRLR